MNDKELLELAAKAAGITLGEFWTPYLGSHHVHFWNSITDDGDSLRLAVGCRLFEDEDFITEVCAIWLYPSPNKQAAVRRAITRAAAEIGKAMP